uniref:Reverse transcriptase zinc-binding domain-containing protein n=1 Tax=Lactuca sativa TaxID=4236 RepID=A0A9R1UDF1_LACSA|nr:hypothetical protein LSAT_V11C900472180 [Lactuca sativa]
MAKRRKGCWGTIVNIPKIFEKENVTFLDHFQLSSNANGSMDGAYSVASFRNHIDNSILPLSGLSWNSLIPGKLNILAWRIYHGKLLSMANLFKFGVGLSNLCRFCNGARETEKHVFCGLYSNTLSLTANLLDGKARLKGNHRPSKIDEAIMLVFIWVNWRSRNFKAHSPNPNSKLHMVLIYEVQTIHLFGSKGDNLRCLNGNMIQF